MYNPFAGGLRRRSHALGRCIELLASQGVSVQSIPTPGPKAAAELARRIADSGADLILVAGGDGTINEVVNGIAGSKIPLGILPAGTANVLANELGLGNRLERAAAAFASWIPERIAVGLLSTAMGDEPRYFLLMAGAGLDAAIVYHMSPAIKNTLGKAAYWVDGLAQFGRRLPQFSVETEGRVYRSSFALVSRVRNYGGDLEIAPTISLLDDEFEVVLFEGATSLPYVKYILGVLAGRIHALRGVTILRTRKVLLSGAESGQVYVQVDGESAGVVPATVELVPNALTLLVPPGFRARRPARAEDAAWTTSPTR
ncbi:MAG TPA: diacylglycerol kinase family protein [Bryobacteraceae bacterium]|nr:diacylglycerol kinase family protein [Bryobacteraceae bacterium]